MPARVRLIIIAWWSEILRMISEVIRFGTRPSSAERPAARRITEPAWRTMPWSGACTSSVP